MKNKKLSALQKKEDAHMSFEVIDSLFTIKADGIMTVAMDILLWLD